MLDFGATAFISILFLVDPPGTVPAFISLTAKYSPAKRRKTALVASLTATLTLAGFAAIGNYLFQVLGLTLPAFQIAGGLILFLVALDMIRAQRLTQEDPEEMKESEEAADVAVAPLAIPMLAGPAALSTVAVLMAQAQNVAQVSLVYLAIAATGLITYITLRLAEPIQRRLGKTGIHILGRVLGLVLAGIAVQFVLNGLTAAGLIAKPKA
jgi:multiple antibiotic resistance protein